MATFGETTEFEMWFAYSHWVMFAEDMMKKTVARLRELAPAAESHKLLSALNLSEHLWPWNLPNLETACRHLTV